MAQDDASVQLYRALLSHDSAEAIRVVERAKRRGVEQARLFDQVFAPALSMLGGAWADGSIDDYSFARASVAAEQITSFVIPPSASSDTGITVLLGTMQGDLHTIGKAIAGAALRDAGHRVVDLGASVRPAEFLQRAEETGACVLIVYAQLEATARSVLRVRETFTAAGRGDVAILVSGGPFAADPSLARAVGANGVVRGAESALRLVVRAARHVEGGAA